MLWRAATVLGTAVAALAMLTGVALAGRFSTPVRLPGEEVPEWHFAINGHGRAVAARLGEEHGHGEVQVFPVRRSGHLGHPWQLAIPEWAPPQPAPAVALDGNRIAVAIDVEEHAPEGGGDSSGSDEHVAIASWQIGRRPPALQVLTPRRDESNYPEGELSHPEIIIGPSAVTALWTAGGRSPEPEERLEPARVDEAFGSAGAPLHAIRLRSITDGRGAITHLALAPDGNPIASWVDGHGRLATVRGGPTGALGQPDPLSANVV